MVQDPYKILGLTESASADEVKRAYKKKVKECHPDLHPNDPTAHERMSQVNEAYDMIMCPEKYTRRQQTSSASSSANSSRTSSSYSSTNSNRGYYSNSQNYSGGYREFSFEDLFGFGFGFESDSDDDIFTPTIESSDIPDMVRAVNEINNKRYSEAINVLTFIPSSYRNARWYYLNSLANHGLGNTVQAIDRIQKAVQLAPDNSTYRKLLNRYQRSEQTYERNAQGFNMNVLNFHKVCLGVMACQFVCGPFGCIRCI